MPTKSTEGLSRSLIDVYRGLSDRLSTMSFGEPVTHVYNPLEYAGEMAEAYLRRYANGRKRVLLLGMNPGPWGMAQTGIPFGEVGAVRNWLKISAPIGSPDPEHPKRPVLGLNCERSEVSGARLWGWASERYKRPAAFFKSFFVANYCPLCFLESTGRNRTPDRLPADEAGPLFEACDDALQSIVELVRPEVLVGVGVFAEKRLRRLFCDNDFSIGRVLHPSPASPIANRGWADRATSELRDIGIAIPGD